MPVLVDRGSHPRLGRRAAECIEIGLVNNMPDAALEATERQFTALLESAAADVAVRLRLFALPGVPRGARTQRHVEASYSDIEELWDGRFDALIVTGTEPRAASLPDEPYWPALTELIDWAENHTVSTVWSCLAAHAAVLHLDGIERRARAEKCIGVFDCTPIGDHPLTEGLMSPFAIPHARHNELRAEELASCGYETLTASAQAGVDTFVRQGRSLFVFFQGHPEYEAASLLGEYRRDLGRYLRRERDIYPAMPRGYFDVATTELLTAFRAQALAERREELIALFPVADVERSLTRPWRAPAVRLYRNWLNFISARKAQTLKPVAAGLRPRLRTARAVPGVATRAESRAVVPGSPLPFIERRRNAASGALWRGPDRRISAVR